MGGFWGIELKPGKKYHIEFPEEKARLQVTGATLGLGDSTGRSIVQCSVGDKYPVFLCSLLPEKDESCLLNLVFENKEPLTFSLIGNQSVHLSGFFSTYGSVGQGFKSSTDNKMDLVPVEEKDDADHTINVTLPSGLKIKDRHVGDGPRAFSGNSVRARYTCYLKDGTYCCKNHKGPPIEFKLGAKEVIEGWEIGVLGMRVGGIRKLTVPPELGYGYKGVPPKIPPDSVLVFDVHVVHVD